MYSASEMVVLWAGRAHGRAERTVWLQCGCCCGWTVKRFASREVQQYCKVSSTQMEHTGHGLDAELPQHTRRGAISSDCRQWILECVQAGHPQAEVIKKVRVQVQTAFADDPDVLGGLKVCTPLSRAFKVIVLGCDFLGDAKF